MTMAFLFSAAAVLATMLGGALVWSRAWPERHLWRFLAFGSGMLLGAIFLHVLPEAWDMSPRAAGASVLIALMTFFAVEEFTVVHACGELMGHCSVHRLGWGALTALFLHSLTDGLAIGVAFLSSQRLGALVAVAVLVHKTSDGLTLASLFRHAGHGRGWTAGVTGLLALATPLGVLAAALARPWISDPVLAVMLGMAAGGFLYVSMSDVLPRLHRTRDHWCWVYLLVGAALSALAPHH